MAASTAQLKELQEKHKYIQDRHTAMYLLVDSIVREVLLAQGINTGTDETDLFVSRNRAMRTQIAQRILGWVNNRLGLVDDLLLGDLAASARQQAVAENLFVTTGSLGFHGTKALLDAAEAPKPVQERCTECRREANCVHTDECSKRVGRSPWVSPDDCTEKPKPVQERCTDCGRLGGDVHSEVCSKRSGRNSRVMYGDCREAQ